MGYVNRALSGMAVAVLAGCSPPPPVDSGVMDATASDIQRVTDAPMDMGPDTFQLPDGGDPFNVPDAPYNPNVLTDAAIPGNAQCEQAPTLPLNTRVEGLPSSTAVTPQASPASCWTGTLAPQLHYKVEVPPWTGVRIGAEPRSGTSDPGVLLTDRCAPGADGTMCSYYTSGFAGRVAYYGNANSVPKTLIVHVRFPSPDPATFFVMETQTFPLFANASCVGASPLAPNTTVTAPRGGSDRMCGLLQERVFFQLSVPPRSLARSLNATVLTPYANCGCTGTTPALRNDTMTPQTLLVSTEGGSAVGWRAVPLETNAFCEGAVVFSPSQPSHGRSTDLAGPQVGYCNLTSNHPLFYQLDIPARTVAHVRATLAQRDDNQGLQLWATGGCSPSSACLGSTENFSVTGAMLDIENTQSTPRTVTVGASLTMQPVSGNQLDMDVTTSAL